MSEALYLEDSYLKEFDATIKEVKDGKYIILDKTAFYARGGGQPHDEGVLIKDGQEYNVVFVGKFDGAISHEVDREGLQVGDSVHGVINWTRRYQLMKCHTAAHILCEIIHKETGALITGNQLDIEKCRIDFSLEDFDPEKMKSYITQANEIIAKDLQVSVSYKSREEAMQMPAISKLAKGLPEHLKTIRIVDIGGFDIQGDGGTHVAHSNEIGTLEFLKVDNKGKNNRRLYFKVNG